MVDPSPRYIQVGAKSRALFERLDRLDRRLNDPDCDEETQAVLEINYELDSASTSNGIKMDYGTSHTGIPPVHFTLLSWVYHLSTTGGCSQVHLHWSTTNQRLAHGYTLP